MDKDYQVKLIDSAAAGGGTHWFVMLDGCIQASGQARNYSSAHYTARQEIEKLRKQDQDNEE